MALSSTVFTLFGAQVSLIQLICWGAALLVLYILFLSLVLEKDPRIRISGAFRKAFRTGRRQFGGLVKFLTVELSLMLLCLTPLLFLIDKSLRFLAVLAVPAWILIIFPVRMNAAEAMQDALNGGEIFTGRLLETDGWWKKVWNGVQRMLFLACWAAPLAAGLIYAYRLWKGADDMDGFTLLQTVQDFGNGDVGQGLLYILLIVLGAILILLVGIAFHSGARHAVAAGVSQRTGSHHGKLIAGWFCSLVIMWPLLVSLAVLVCIGLTLVGDLNGIVLNAVKLPAMSILLGVFGAGFLLTLPLLPFRSLVTAAMVHQLKEDREKAAQ